mmetsp:Transcript_39704/g.54018  ORF Transcript_39704/g.54018 Transcript_39704/m.54018 type:complete len:242 (+) Transcript_39704:887-1612(+)
MGAVAMPSSWLVTRKARNSSKHFPSALKSSSPRMAVRRSSTMFARDRRDRFGAKNSSTFPATAMNPRSAFSVSATPGFWTLTTTSSPVRSVAACTCATEADANGVSSNLLYTSVMDLPRSFSTIPFTVLKSTAGVSSRHFWNSSTYSAGNIVGELAINCPSLTYVAPRRSNSRRSVLGASSGGRDVTNSCTVSSKGFAAIDWKGILPIGSSRASSRAVSTRARCPMTVRCTVARRPTSRAT